MDRLTQDAPFPTILQDLIDRVQLDPEWSVRLVVKTRDTGSPDQGSGLTLSITTLSFDTYHPELGRTYRVLHDFAVPPATYNEGSWRRWLFDRYQDVIRHEGMEFFAIRPACTCGWTAKVKEGKAFDGEEPHEHAATCPARPGGEDPYRPYAPNHGPGNDPYTVREETTDLDRRTQYTGNLDHR